MIKEKIKPDIDLRSVSGQERSFRLLQSLPYDKKNEQFSQMLLLILELPQRLLNDLYKIQAAQGIPLGALLKTQFESFVIDNWDFETDSPRKERWDG